jgi:hypothetical protein
MGWNRSPAETSAHPERSATCSGVRLADVVAAIALDAIVVVTCAGCGGKLSLATGRYVAVLWTTRYMEVGLAHLRQQGVAVATADVARLSPLGSAQINLLGRYEFTLAEPLARGELRPLQDPRQAHRLELDSA